MDHLFGAAMPTHVGKVVLQRGVSGVRGTVRMAIDGHAATAYTHNAALDPAPCLLGVQEALHLPVTGPRQVSKRGHECESQPTHFWSASLSPDDIAGWLA